MTSALELLKALRERHDPLQGAACEQCSIDGPCPDVAAADAGIKEIERLTHELADAHGVAQACEARAEAAEAKLTRIEAAIDAGLSMSQIKHRLKQ